MPVTFSAEAQEDLRELIAHVAQDSLEQALALADTLERFCLTNLPETPNIGRPFDQQTRVVTKDNFQIFYRVDDTQVSVLRVLHSARNRHAIMRDTKSPLE